jgi:hypothetical protein
MRSKLVRVGALVALLTGAAVVAFGGLGFAGDGAPVVDIGITKTVVGTDPGIAFPITLTCDSQGLANGAGVGAADFQIPNDGENSEVVNLHNGESTTVHVELPPQAPDVATCRVTEDLSGTTLPEGFTCTPAVTPESVIVYDGSPHDGDFTVTNTCTQAVPQVQAVVALPTTTG